MCVYIFDVIIKTTYLNREKEGQLLEMNDKHGQSVSIVATLMDGYIYIYIYIGK